MPTTAADLAGATDSQILAARNALIAYLQERWPNLAIRGGPLADLVLGPSGNALAAVDVIAAEAALSYNPEEALAQGGYNSTILDSVLAGRGVQRTQAAAASGSAGIRLTSSTTRSFPAGFKFQTADGVEFATSQSTRLLAPGSTAVLANDYVLVADAEGETFLAVVAISCRTTGLSGNRAAGTTLEAVDTFDSLDSAWIAVDTAGGLDEETDAELLARLPAASAPRTAASIAGAEGLIRDAIPAASTLSSIKFGDPEMVRGRSVLSTQTPGRFDVRFRTESSPSREGTTVEAELISIDPEDIGTWRFTLTRDISPGRFLVEKILRTDQGVTEAGINPTVTPGFDLSDIDDPPDIRSVADAALTRYATALVTFADPSTSTTGLEVGDMKDYQVVCRLIAGVEDGQAAVDVADAKAAGGDCLVRTAVPCLVSVTAAATPAAGVSVTVAEVRAAVAQAINSAAKIDSRLLASQVAAEAAVILPKGTALLLSNWSGTIYPNDGDDPVMATADQLGLTVADNLPRNISAATVAYYCDPESVTASVS